MPRQTLSRRPAHKHYEPPERRLFDVIDGRFEPLQEIGCGAVCLVHLAEDKRSGKTVAIKRLRADMLEKRNARFALLTEKSALSLVREARNPGIPKLFAYSLDRQDPYIAEQFMDGLPFALNNIHDARTVMVLSIAICGILGTLHRAGIVYRDLKPSNIVLGHDRRSVSLTDFGFSIVPGIQDLALRTDLAVGTPMFMAPEQTYPGVSVDCRVDVYSMGVMMYQFLTGWHPYTVIQPPKGLTPEQIQEHETQEYFRAHRSQEAVPLHARNPSMPVRLSYVVARAMAKEPEKRYRDAEDLADAISDCLSIGY